MNIFALDHCPTVSAEQQCDKHVVKMILESAQMLCSAHRVLDGDEPADRRGLYRKTHANHPCSVWVRHATANYQWLCSHALALCDEYTRRYGRRHKSQDIIEWCNGNRPDNLPLGYRTPFAQAMPDEHKHDDPVVAYRQYYRAKRSEIDMRWTERETPEWLK